LHNPGLPTPARTDTNLGNEGSGALGAGLGATGRSEAGLADLVRLRDMDKSERTLQAFPAFEHQNHTWQQSQEMIEA